MVRIPLLFTKRQILGAVQVKLLAEDKENVAKIIISVLDRVENIVGTGENAGYQNVLLFLHCFQKVSLLRLLKVF